MVYGIDRPEMDIVSLLTAFDQNVGTNWRLAGGVLASACQNLNYGS